MREIQIELWRMETTSTNYNSRLTGCVFLIASWPLEDRSTNILVVDPEFGWRNGCKWHTDQHRRHGDASPSSPSGDTFFPDGGSASILITISADLM
jgi:hypothetical protein